MELEPAVARDLYRRMVLIREAEERIAALYPEKEMRCPTHLSIGQEAVAAGVCAALRREDAVFLNHRCHAGYLAKGGDMKAMMAELYGKATGCTRGRGGSMHLMDPAAGLLGTSAILAGTVPIACGAAFSFARAKTDRIAAAFFGDACVEEGTFWESVNMAAVWRLPVLFVCENNGLSTTTPLSKRQPSVPIHPRVAAFGVPSVHVDGNDVAAVYAAARDAARRAKEGGGPSFIECATYRWREHVGPNFDWNLGYRTQAEVEAWMERCPLKRFEAALGDGGRPSANERKRIRAEVLAEVDAAVKFAKESPFPEPSELAADEADA